MSLEVMLWGFILIVAGINVLEYVIREKLFEKEIEEAKESGVEVILVEIKS